MIEVEHEIFVGIYYLHKADHRNGSPKKSQWIITKDEERSSFKRAFNSKWIVLSHSESYWGLHFDEHDQVANLGISKSSGPDRFAIFIAKFVDGNKNDKWHGYPANHVMNNQDIPPEEILLKWARAEYIRKQLIRKLLGGMKCKLSK